MKCLLLQLYRPSGPWMLFQFSIYTQSVGFLGRAISLSQGLYLHSTTDTHIQRTQTSMPWVGFESTIPAFERAKTVQALDLAATSSKPHFILFPQINCIDSPLSQKLTEISHILWAVTLIRVKVFRLNHIMPYFISPKQLNRY
jgi:hypothetical protein